MSDVRYDIVVPTIGRECLAKTLAALSAGSGPLPGRLVLVDDRRGDVPPLALDGLSGDLAERVQVIRSNGRGPAAARNAGWRACSSEWIAFLDDDVIPPIDWRARLVDDLAHLDAGVGASQGHLDVPLPLDRRPTDWERNVAGLERAQWATADMAYRRSVLEEVDGLDERFQRAYREDADLGLRTLGRGYRIVWGNRRTWHPVRPADTWVSVRLQRGNADDALMRRLHGRDWRGKAAAPPGRFRWHVATTAAAAASLFLAGKGRAGAAAVWLALTGDFMWRRIAPGPRTPDEIAKMAATSVAIPPVAVWHRLLGEVRWRGRRELRRNRNFPVAAVLFDRDGTLVVDVPYNGDPSKVQPVPGAREAVRRLRDAGIAVGVVSNQSGIARGLIDHDDVGAVNARIDQLLGPFDVWAICAHGPADLCPCRKPAPGLVHEAARRLGVRPEQCLVIGDIGSDVDAARAAGARAILVPTALTRPEEVERAPEVSSDILDAVGRVLEDAR